MHDGLELTVVVLCSVINVQSDSTSLSVVSKMMSIKGSAAGFTNKGLLKLSRPLVTPAVLIAITELEAFNHDELKSLAPLKSMRAKLTSVISTPSFAQNYSRWSD